MAIANNNRNGLKYGRSADSATTNVRESIHSGSIDNGNGNGMSNITKYRKSSKSYKSGKTIIKSRARQLFSTAQYFHNNNINNDTTIIAKSYIINSPNINNNNRYLKDKNTKLIDLDNVHEYYNNNNNLGQIITPNRLIMSKTSTTPQPQSPKSPHETLAYSQLYNKQNMQHNGYKTPKMAKTGKTGNNQ